MTIKANNYLEEIISYKPGKSKIGLSDAIKLSANENALGCSPKVQEAYKNIAQDIWRYSDGSCTKLRETIANKYNLNAEQIVCGAGSDELIALLTQGFCQKEDEIIYSHHGFLMYPISAKRVGAKAVRAAEQDLKTDINAIINSITEKTKIIFIANPNNPTGSYLTKDEIYRLIELTPKNILIVFDHAYDEFVTNKDYPKDILKLVAKNDNIVITRTFSKIYGLASLRVGWCYGSKYVADILNKIRGPFNVSGPAQISAIAALQDNEFLEKSIEHNSKWLKIYFDSLVQNTNFKIHKSVGNFVLIDFFDKNNCDKANIELQNKNIMVREMSSYDLSSALRITIGNNQENEMVISELQNFIRL
jgi:histidinol-phosphate aminotransferase